MKPRIGITCGEVYNVIESWAPMVYGQMHTYVDAVIAAGGAPILLPITKDVTTLRELYELCDGLLMSGGNDVGPENYGEESIPETVKVSEARDTQELQLLKWALADKKPVLAICRGMQILNVARGGSLYQDVLKQIPGASDHTESSKHQDFAYLSHPITIEHSSQLANILGCTQLQTNMHHHQAVKQPGLGVVATSHAEDGVIEAIELPELPFAIGVQSHPEVLTQSVPEWARLFEAFTQAARAAKR